MSTDYYRSYARAAAVRNGLNPDIFEAQINQESGFNPSARSSAGAVGIAQIMPNYHPDVDPTDPKASLDYAARLMSNYLKGNGGNYADALARYNAGSGNVNKYGLDVVLSDSFARGETKRYVANILNAAGLRARDGASGTAAGAGTAVSSGTTTASKLLPSLPTTKVGSVFGQDFSLDTGPLAKIAISVAAVVLVFVGVTKFASGTVSATTNAVVKGVTK